MLKSEHVLHIAHKLYTQSLSCALNTDLSQIQSIWKMSSRADNFVVLIRSVKTKASVFEHSKRIRPGVYTSPECATGRQKSIIEQYVAGLNLSKS